MSPALRASVLECASPLALLATPTANTRGWFCLGARHMARESGGGPPQSKPLSRGIQAPGAAWHCSFTLPRLADRRRNAFGRDLHFPAAVAKRSPSPRRDWNGTLFTMPLTSAEKR